MPTYLVSVSSAHRATINNQQPGHNKFLAKKQWGRSTKPKCLFTGGLENSSSGVLECKFLPRPGLWALQFLFLRQGVSCCLPQKKMTACYVRYNGNINLTGYKDPSTDLWILPITPDAIDSQEKLRTSQGHDSVSPHANRILLCHHVEHATIAPACAALAQE